MNNILDILRIKPKDKPKHHPRYLTRKRYNDSINTLTVDAQPWEYNSTPLGEAGYSPNNRILRYNMLTTNVAFFLEKLQNKISGCNVRILQIKMTGAIKNNMNTTFVRSTNDYSISLHELFSIHSGEQIPSSSSIVHLTDAGFEKIDEIHTKIMDYITSLNPDENKVVQLSDVEFDDNADTPDSYSVYNQNMSLHKTSAGYVGVELLGCKNVVCVTLLASDKAIRADITKFIKGLKPLYCIKKKDVAKRFYTISQSQQGFELEPLDIKNGYDENTLIDNYNEDFTKVHEVIIGHITSESKGLVLMHGIPGSGKTSYIKHLITRGSERKIVYIPTHLTASISSPQFISFVRQELANCVLVIEDAESVLISRESNESHKEAVSNILNMTDGILADALNLLIICTFNTDIAFLDKALLRKGRLLLQYEFKELTVESANRLSNKLYGKDVGESIPLCDIYGLNYELIKPTEVVKKAFGFNQ